MLGSGHEKLLPECLQRLTHHYPVTRGERERESVCVCTCLRERERDRGCVRASNFDITSKEHAVMYTSPQGRFQFHSLFTSEFQVTR